MRNKNAIYAHSVELKIPFYDLDPMFIVWHGNYLKYFERAREALLNQLGFGYTRLSASGYSYPIVDCRLKFIKSARFESEIIVTAYLIEYEHRLKINYLITDKQSGERLTEGSTIQVAVDHQTQEICFMTPPVLLEHIRSFLDEHH